MKTYVLLHGAWHGPWCWEKICPLLTAKGHTVITPNIPWTFDALPPNQSLNIESITTQICELIIDLKIQVTLVGHSMAGLLISNIISRIPDHVSSAFYICGFIPANGQSINDLESIMSGSTIASNMFLDQKKRSMVIPDTYIKEGFYHDCNELDYKFAKQRVQPQLASTFLYAIDIDFQKLTDTRKIYIECENDKAVPITAQREMQKNMNFDQIFSLSCGHSPFFSLPEKLVQSLCMR